MFLRKKYIKLFCRQHGSATGDHCVYGGAKLYKEGYTEEVQKLDFIKTMYPASVSPFFTGGDTSFSKSQFIPSVEVYICIFTKT